MHMEALVVQSIWRRQKKFVNEFKQREAGEKMFRILEYMVLACVPNSVCLGVLTV